MTFTIFSSVGVPVTAPVMAKFGMTWIFRVLYHAKFYLHGYCYPSGVKMQKYLTEFCFVFVFFGGGAPVSTTIHA